MATNKEQLDFLKEYLNKFRKADKLSFATIEYVGFMQTLREIYNDNLFVDLLLQKENVLRLNFKNGKPIILDIMEKAFTHYEEIP